MATHRFNVTRVSETDGTPIQSLADDGVPRTNVNMAPSSVSQSPAFVSINEVNKPSTEYSNLHGQRSKPYSSSKFVPPILHSTSLTNLTHGGDRFASSNSTTHSNKFDTSTMATTNHFLHELRSKCRELHEKSKHLPIDQRIALNRPPCKPTIRRAQDIFDVIFAADDFESPPYEIFDEDTQDRIRASIFHELDRQRKRQYQKQHRQRIVGRALLMLMISLLTFMSITLIYAIIDLYHRVDYFERKLSEKEFAPMIDDEIVDFFL